MTKVSGGQWGDTGRGPRLWSGSGPGLCSSLLATLRGSRGKEQTRVQKEKLGFLSDRRAWRLLQLFLGLPLLSPVLRGALTAPVFYVRSVESITDSP